MLLENKVAVIYGGGGGVGGAVARAFAREGAQVFLTDRTLPAVEAVAKDIVAAGGLAEVAQVDALDEQAIESHLGAVIAKAGTVDISFNAVGIPNTTLQGVPLVELKVEEFSLPISTYTKSNFLTARLAARRMIAKRAGVILTITSTPSRTAIPNMGGVAVAMGAIETLTRDLSAELGPHGIRVLGLRPAGMPDSGTIKEVWGLHARANGITSQQFAGVIESRMHRGRSPSLTEMAEVAAFAASDRANAMTATFVNMSGGTIAD